MFYKYKYFSIFISFEVLLFVYLLSESAYADFFDFFLAKSAKFVIISIIFEVDKFSLFCSQTNKKS